MERLTFLLSIFAVCGPVAILVWHREERLLKKYELVLLVMVTLSIIFVGPADYFALNWGAWRYGSSVTSGIYVLTLPETYLFGMAVTALVAAVTIVLATQLDRREQQALTARKKRAKATRPPRRGQRHK